jgi:general secretion pathway protein D
MSLRGQNNTNMPATPVRLSFDFFQRLLAGSALAGCLLLAGCAAQTAYREGRELANAGKPSEALAKFEEAARLDSASAEYRIASIQTRERLVSESLSTANRALAGGDPDNARQAFNRVLVIQPNESRALEGLRAIDASGRHNKWLANAETAIGKKDDRGAQMWARMVLSEDSKNGKALTILQSLEQNTEKTVAASGLADAYRKPITIEFKDAPLKTVFEVISRTSGLNFLFDKDVKTDQKTSIFLKNSSIEAAVNLTLLTNQLEQRVLDGNTVLIYPNTQAKQKDYQPLTVRSFYLANGEAKNVANTLKTILKSRDVVVDDKLNMIILRDTPEAVRLAEKLVALHDVQEPEVMLEVEILEVKRTRLLDLGIRWPEQLSLSPIAASTGALTLSDLRRLSSDTLGATIGPISINAKKQDTDANILANPRIRVRNREKAKILIGERVPNISSTATATGFVSESVTYVDVGLKLDVEPTIYLDGEVAIKISLEVSNVVNQVQTKSGSLAYQIGTRTAQTVLRLKDNENQVLAGLINDEDRRSGNKVPGLGEIPIAGRLFGSQADDNSKTEIVLSITPRILRNVQRPSAATMEFDSGTETSLSGRSSNGSSPSANFSGVSPPLAGPSSLVSNTPGISTAPAGTAGVPSGANPNSVTPPVGTGGSGVSSNPASITPPGGIVGSSQLRWQGPTQLKVGDSLALQLLMQSDQPVVSLPMAVGFDARALQVTSVTEGEFLKQNGGQTSFTSRVDPNGQILMTGTRAGDSGATVLGSIATVNFRVVAATSPETQIQLLTISPIALGGRGVNTALPAPHVISIAP